MARHVARPPDLDPGGRRSAEQQVLAYLDPGSGSMIVQILVGGLAAIGVTMKLYWRRLTALFGRKKVEEEG
jgi:hypothetical protein